MNEEKGLKQINKAKWVRDDRFGFLDLHVTHEKGTDVHCNLSLRPFDCDRGHIRLLIDANYLYLDYADSFPRYFFSFEEADKHTREFLKWRLWKHRSHPHTLITPETLISINKLNKKVQPIKKLLGDNYLILDQISNAHYNIVKNIGDKAIEHIMGQPTKVIIYNTKSHTHVELSLEDFFEASKKDQKNICNSIKKSLGIN